MLMNHTRLRALRAARLVKGLKIEIGEHHAR
jgi:hypothetical protein